MSSQEYYQGQQGGYPAHPQASYGPPQGQYGPPQGQYYAPPQGQPPMQYQQAPPPQESRGRRGGSNNCLVACLAALCCCCAVEEGCECCKSVNNTPCHTPPNGGRESQGRSGLIQAHIRTSLGGNAGIKNPYANPSFSIDCCECLLRHEHESFHIELRRENTLLFSLFYSSIYPIASPLTSLLQHEDALRIHIHVNNYREWQKPAGASRFIGSRHVLAKGRFMASFMYFCFAAFAVYGTSVAFSYSGSGFFYNPVGKDWDLTGDDDVL
ncbi:hypothetical protein X797_005782 [Metarhizium robertsii]|uniref:Cysteine-rich transmembrane domain-containing protein n=1 Tax=Metarhizium robertsii TaxID=568076 RepID=A0A014PB13_9HYPO|nr:hypothetical protein X797_005782 [Metarhizium robertsii]